MQKKVLVWAIGLFILIGCQPLDIEDTRPRNDFKIHTYYVVPADKNYSDNNITSVWRGVFEAQKWFQTATGGLTFEILDQDNIVEVYFAQHPSSYYEEDWWSLLLSEIRDYGGPIESPGTIALIWVEGITQITDETLSLGGWSCDRECGAAILPISTLLGPTSLPTDMGVVFHEIGHTLGLSHPVEQSDLPLSDADEVMLYSVMCQSDLRAGTSSSEHGFLTSEKAALAQNPFLKPNVTVYQDMWSTNIINYPVLGPVPKPTIEYEIVNASTVKFTSNIEDGLLYYWYFGDGTTSTEASPTHSYNRAALYNVTLMITNENYMAGRVSQYINLN
jgi:hypothetical protein